MTRWNAEPKNAHSRRPEISAADADLAALVRHADLPGSSPAELLGPLLRSYVSRLRAEPNHEGFVGELAINFDASWDDE